MTGLVIPTRPGTSVAAAVTALFAPGDRPERFAKAAASGADVVIIDLEDAVRTAFRPTQDQISWARKVVDQITTSGEAAVQLDGQMIDNPVIDKARRILRRAGQDAS